MTAIQENKLRHAPTLNTVLMVEEVLKNIDDYNGILTVRIRLYHARLL